jgi:hypothetical protein
LPVNKPRRPRKPLTPSVKSSRSVSRGATQGQRLANKLAKQYEEQLRRNAAQQARSDRSRVGRAPLAQDVFTDTNSTPATQDDFGQGSPGDAFAEGVIERISEPEMVQLGLWGDDEDDTEQTAQLPTATEYYSPTRSINPPRPRTREMTYNRQTRVLRIVYRDGGTYDYFSVPGSIWYRIKQVRSPGRFIDRNIKGEFRYERVAGS